MNTPKSANEKEEKADKEMRRQIWVLLFVVLVTFIIAVLAYGFFLLHAETACYLVESNIYTGIWPPNLQDADVLLGAGYARPDSCILLSTRSVISAVMLIYIFYLFVSQIWIKDVGYVPKLIPISMFLILGYLYTSTKVISTEPASIYTISTHSGVVVNLIKSYVKICGLYLGISLFIQRMFALLRLKYNTGRER
ncbi:hypothetical protein ACC718_10170 [Rhizobium ruizarguesonis]|uniref:hypothetical protein n=1 Tax=Rhizobium ruizarguesonis TaxID=2081791 RepID=UPI0013DF448A|nr:hypothetical protein [Rhizobium ruizarguesonis]NEJ95012.1 hypothetical protein [Rhizobium ruizarguesonis]